MMLKLTLYAALCSQHILMHEFLYRWQMCAGSHLMQHIIPMAALVITLTTRQLKNVL